MLRDVGAPIAAVSGVRQQPEPHPPSSAKLTQAASGWFEVSGVTSDDASSALDMFIEQLASHGFSTASLSHVNVYLRTQADFPLLNRVYQSYFGVSPPSRACIAIPQQVSRFALSATGYHRPSQPQLERRALHVQGRSYWAPANIGPYSQAVRIGGRISIAGQIALGAADGVLRGEGDGELQTVLSLQHTRRIASAVLETRTDAHWVEAGVCWVTSPHLACRAAIAANTTWSKRTPMAYILLARDALPRGAEIEWQVTVAAPDAVFDEEGGEEDVRAIYDASESTQEELAWNNVRASTGTLASGIAFARAGASLEPLRQALGAPLSLRLFIATLDSVAVLAARDWLQKTFPHAALMVLPVLGIWSGEQREWDLAISWSS